MIISFFVRSFRLLLPPVTAIAVCLATFASAQPTRPEVGGLSAPEIGASYGPNLLINGNFQLGKEGWRIDDPAWSLDATVTNDGFPSLRLRDTGTSKWPPVATNTARIGHGMYALGGMIKAKDLIGKGPREGARFALQGASAGKSPIVRGTLDWTKEEIDHARVDPAHATFKLMAYGRPSGTAWFKNLWVRAELPPPIRTFLVYPNYRGLLFDDSPQQVSVAVEVAEPSPARVVLLELLNGEGKTVASHQYKADRQKFTAVLDAGGLALGRYSFRGVLLDSGGRRLFVQSAYAIVKADHSLRSGMKAWVDPDNIVHLGGRPRFVLGIYDTSGYSDAVSPYHERLTGIARAPVNAIINYLITGAPVPAIRAYAAAMQGFGMFFFATVNDFYPDNKYYPKHLWGASTGADALIKNYAGDLSGDRGVVGYYVADEPKISMQPRVFHQYQIIKESDPFSLTLMVSNKPDQLDYWRDSVDIVATDSYPVGVAPLNQVGDWTRTAEEAVEHARPVWAVIQFFAMRKKAGWPTEHQLHDMSWMAITEGATGLFYWSYGMRALSWVKDPAEKERLYQMLIHVTSGIRQLEPVLLSPDRKVLSSNSLGDTVRTKEKAMPGGSRYVISYNHSATAQTVTLTLAAPGSQVNVYGEQRAVQLDATHRSFSDVFAPYEAHVYEIK